MDNSSTIFDESKWLSFKKNLKKNVGDTAFNNWLKHLNYVSFQDTTITFSVPTKFLRDWIVNNYSDKIKTEAKNHIVKVDTIKFVVKPSGGRIVPGTTRTIKSNENHWKSSMDVRSNQSSNYPNEFGAPLDPRFTFENFVTSKILWRKYAPSKVTISSKSTKPHSTEE